MKKLTVLFVALFAMLFVSCNETTKYEEILEQYVEETFNDPDSYELVSLEVNWKGGVYDYTPILQKYIDTIDKLAVEREGIEKRMSDWKSENYLDHYIYGKEYKYTDEDSSIFKRCDSLTNKIYQECEANKSSLDSVGVVLDWKYRTNNKSGALTLYEDQVFISIDKNYDEEYDNYDYKVFTNRTHNIYNLIDYAMYGRYERNFDRLNSIILNI